ncbi:MAG: Threonine-tRNA ligase [Candidatus Moranbacteria bacterium GW2011_GWE2_47_10]|nr:MAG: Threonine-tRNA ligase [Candidatus Moranbacteria bacterium GW2011_GWE2_47_10]HBP01558.1 hypothetical protein [Candidatus Moranbacteria bacterium]
MKCLFLDAIEYGAGKPREDETEQMEDCLVILVTFEIGDGEKQVKRLVKEIRRIARKCGSLGTRNVALVPFCHLSSRLLDPESAKRLLSQCEQLLKKSLDLLVSEFGVEKGLLLNVRTCQGNIKFREF